MNGALMGFARGAILAGDPLELDDVVRVEDDYGRAKAAGS